MAVGAGEAAALKALGAELVEAAKSDSAFSNESRFDRARYSSCPGPITGREMTDRRFRAHGINVRAGPNGVHTLYVVHHTQRESVEIFEVDARGNVVRYEIHDGVINSDARMTYTAVNAILTDHDEAVIDDYRDLVPMFELMRELFEILNTRRRRRGSIDFDLPEAEVILSELGQIEDIVALERNVAHRLIEEFMLLANETVAAHLVANDVPA